MTPNQRTLLYSLIIILSFVMTILILLIGANMVMSSLIIIIEGTWVMVIMKLLSIISKEGEDND